MDQAQVDQDKVDEAAELSEALQQQLLDVVPTKLVAPANREPLAESFVDFLERLDEFLEQYKPLNQGQMAALLYFVDSLQLDRVGSDHSFVIRSLVDAAKDASRKLRPRVSSSAPVHQSRSQESGNDGLASSFARPREGRA
jgi:broad specificity phosphatase PhoE